MIRDLACGSLLTALTAVVPCSYAHHAFSADFDANLPTHVTGKVVKVEWINPHAWVHVESEEVDRVVWELEAGTPNTLVRPNPNTVNLEGRDDDVPFPIMDLA